MSEIDSREMTCKVTASLAWAGTLHAVGLGMNLAFTAILARLLAPADFGVMAGAMIFLCFVQLVSRGGIVPTLVQLPTLSVADLRGAFTLVVIAATVAFGFLELFAPYAASFLRLEAVEPVLRLLAFVLLIEALGIVAETLLIRRLEVRRVMMIELAGRVIGTGAVGISLAYMGWGYWALVVAILTDTAFRAVALLCLVRPPLLPLFSLELLQLLGFRSAGFTLRGILNYIATNADNAIVARYFDAVSLGLYSRAYHLMSLPANFYDNVASRVVFPAMSRVQEKPVRLKAAFLRGLSLTAMLGLPLCAVLLVLAEDVVRLVLGGQWLSVVPIFMVLATSMYLRLGAKLSSSLLNATGSVLTLVIIQAIYAASVIAFCLVAYPYGIVALAGAVCAAIFVYFGVISTAACRRAGVSGVEFARAHVRGALLAGLTGCLTWVSSDFWWSADFEGLVPILSSIFVLSLLAMLLVSFRPRMLLGRDGAEFFAGMQSLIAERFAYFARG